MLAYVICIGIRVAYLIYSVGFYFFFIIILFKCNWVRIEKLEHKMIYDDIIHINGWVW